ncbi:GerAB/ArcD/ProY family transporter [Desulfotruncus alcoholivorax]|uniref:GerAB/ArcD/ProY family transporter n=1 Tax=Desulfotruncus alcoholivorax TaxID=265477 RepID=UPI000403369B|nr:endospore germination permease [Desulfotruncus alcoholivorax]
MLKDIKISNKQAIYININMVIATGWLSAPAIIAEKAKQDAWISLLTAILLSIPIAWITSRLSSLYPGKTLIEYLEDILGLWPGKILAFFYLLWFIHITSIMFREYSEFLTDVFMPETPLVVFPVVATLVIAYAVTKGLEVLARTLEVFFPWIILSILVLFLLLIPEMDINRLLPVFETNAVDIFKGSLVPMGWMTEIFTFAMFIPFLNKPQQSLKVTIASTILVGLNFLLHVAGSLLVFGASISSMMYPVLNAARLISVSKFIQRPEPIIMAIWIAGGLIKIAVFYFVIVFGMAQWLRLKDYRPLVLPVGVILIALSVIVANNTIDISIFLAHVWPFYSLLLFQFGIPVMLLMIALIKRKILPKS